MTDTFQKLKQLHDQIQVDSQKAFSGTVSRGRSARKALSELSKLCKQARQELLEQMKKSKGEED